MRIVNIPKARQPHLLIFTFSNLLICIMIWTKNDYTISTDKTSLSLEYIHKYLSEQSYWAKGIPLHTVKRSIEGAMCFGVYKDAQMVGFARVITDNATFGYLADVFIDEAYRGKGLSKWLMEVI